MDTQPSIQNTAFDGGIEVVSLDDPRVRAEIEAVVLDPTPEWDQRVDCEVAAREAVERRRLVAEAEARQQAHTDRLALSGLV